MPILWQDRRELNKGKGKGKGNVDLLASIHETSPRRSGIARIVKGYRIVLHVHPAFHSTYRVNLTINSAIADKPRDAFVKNMRRHGWPLKYAPPHVTTPHLIILTSKCVDISIRCPQIRPRWGPAVWNLAPVMWSETVGLRTRPVSDQKKIDLGLWSR